VSTSESQPRLAQIHLRGPYDLREVALMGFGHRDEKAFDGVMRLAFCADASPGRSDYDHQVGVEVRQSGQDLELRVHDRPGRQAELDVVTAQVARVLSADQDGEAFEQICRGDRVLAQLHQLAPGFRPALFYSPYEAAVWSIVSARRARPQGIRVRARLAEQDGNVFELAGEQVAAIPTPSALLGVEAVPGLPADRIPRLHAIAEAARQGLLATHRLTALAPEEALADLQRLPGIGPFYSRLVLFRACGLTDVLAAEEPRSREAIGTLYGFDHEPTDTELTELAERWRPFRTWATVMIRAIGGRLQTPAVA
jgi:DNA-3-methyladenine glycosylase II